MTKRCESCGLPVDPSEEKMVTDGAGRKVCGPCWRLSTMHPHQKLRATGAETHLNLHR